MFATKAASPFSNRSATRGRLACTPNLSHGCEPGGVDTSWRSKDRSGIIPVFLIATLPRAAVYSSNKSMPFSFLVHFPAGISMLKLSQPPDMKSTCNQFTMRVSCRCHAQPCTP